MLNIDKYLEDKRCLVDRALRSYLPKRFSDAPTLTQAVLYSLFPGGKRFRPILTLASSEAVGGRPTDVLPVACALELIHTYSLIHDDLPALDNDSVRRGRPSTHVVFGEAMAILAGDALLTEAFRILSDAALRKRKKNGVLEAIHEIALAAGSKGMVGGQVLDMTQKKRRRPRSLEHIYALKTGALIRASVVSGARLGGARPQQLLALSRYGEFLGLAFQIADDIRDDGLKKEDGYPSHFGLKRAWAKAQELERKAVAALDGFGERADPLRALVSYVVGYPPKVGGES